MNDKVILREVGLRDGLQIVQAVVDTKDKLEWIAAEHEAGVSEIEVCSLVPAKLMPQFADSQEVIAGALTNPDLVVSALIPNVRGAERGVMLGVQKLNFVMSVSEGHNRANVRRTVNESYEEFVRVAEMLRHVPSSERPKLSGGLSTCFGCTIEGSVAEQRVIELAVRLAEAGADEIVIADTVGYGSPDAVQRVFKRALSELAPLPVIAHFHDTRGLGLANAFAALDSGVRYFDATLGGLGGCPHAPGATGNVVMEDLAYLCETMGMRTSINLERLLAVRQIVARALPGERLVGAIAIAGLPRNHKPVIA